MPKLVRSAKGQVIDFELLAIKQQLANSPIPKVVEDRQHAIDLKDGVKTSIAPAADMLAAATEAAAASAATGRQLKRK